MKKLTEKLITVRVKPRAHRDEIRAGAAGELEIRVAAVPIGGAANERLLRVLADYLDIPASRLRIVSGRTGRRKRIAIRDAPG